MNTEDKLTHKKLRVAHMAGSLVHARNTCLYQAIPDPYEVSTVVARRFDIAASDIGLPQVRLLTKRDLFRRIPKLRHRIPWDDQQHYFGFEPAMADMDILFPQGTIMKFAYQSILMKRKTGVKVVVTDYQNIPFFYHDRSASKQAERKAVIMEADAVVACLHQIKQSMVMEGFPEEKIEVIGHGVRTDIFQPGPKDPKFLDMLNLGENDIVVSFMGEFSWRKGVKSLVYAAKLLAQDAETRDAPVKFLLLGSRGSAEMRAFLQSIGLADRVVVQEWVGFDQMPEAYRCSDIVVIPSNPIPSAYEQTSSALHEAMASGKALIVSKLGGMPEVMGDAGLYFAPADHEALYLAIKEFVLDDKKRIAYGEKSHARALECLDTRVTLAKLAKVFDRVLNRKS